MEGCDSDDESTGYLHLNQAKGTSYEEQFKQLYELTPDPDRRPFLNDLFSYMQNRGTPINRIPIMAKQVLDLFELYRLVVARGGLVEVINKKIWREITRGLNLPSSITSAAFTLRTQYMKYLYPYECEKEHLSSPEELQQAIDGNRREGRRSSFGHYDMCGSSPLSLVNRHQNGGGGQSVPNNNNGHNYRGGSGSFTHQGDISVPMDDCGSESSDGEEDNGTSSIHSLPLNPLVAFASAQPQAEPVNLEMKGGNGLSSLNGLNGGSLSSLQAHLNSSSNNQNIEINNNSLSLSMNINNVIYSGTLYATRSVKR